MAKQNCALCGAEIGLLAQQQLADKNYICRKVCVKKCMKLFDFVPATLDQVKAHIEQVEFGTKAWEQIFVPLLKTKNKEEKIKDFGQYGALRVSPSTGLVALIQNDYKFFIFGKTTKACVYRLADLYTYEYDSEVTKDSEGKETVKHFCYLGFRNVYGLSEIRLPISSVAAFNEMEKYFDTLFGIQKTLRNSLNNARRQINAVKNVTAAVKSIVSGENDVEKGKAAIDALDANAYGDRTEWIKKADEALASVK
ncbi:MAG: hypothetical protein IJB24_06195 [Clostridia bacterium]|nr:hypothetical protein [Clostridia bacterium]